MNMSLVIDNGKSVLIQGDDLRFREFQKWSLKEDDTLISLIENGTNDNKELSELMTDKGFSRSAEGIRHRRVFLEKVGVYPQSSVINGYPYSKKEDRQLIKLREEEGLTYREIGKRMRRKESSVARRYSRLVNGK